MEREVFMYRRYMCGFPGIFYLNCNVCSIHVDGNDLWAASAYPESCVYRFVLNEP